MRFAIRRERRSSPYSKMMRAISSSESRCSSSAAVSSSPAASSRISRGASKRKLKPRPGESSWKDETPKSTNTPCGPSWPASASTRAMSRKLACTAQNRSPKCQERLRNEGFVEHFSCLQQYGIEAGDHCEISQRSVLIFSTVSSVCQKTTQ